MKQNERIKEIKRRCELTTYGEWIEDEPRRIIFAEVDKDNPKRGHAIIAETIWNDADRKFIINARADILWLIEQVKKGKKVIDEAHKLVKIHDQNEDDIPTWEYFFDKALDRQRDAIKTYDEYIKNI
jgi:lipopolysaccharide biosynthesis regulator YciM